MASLFGDSLSGGTFSRALGQLPGMPSFKNKIPTVGGGLMGDVIPSIGGTGAANFSSAPGSNFDTQKFLQTFLQGQSDQMQNQPAPETHRSKLLQGQQPFLQTPADFNPMQNKGLDQDQLKMLIAALRGGNGQ